MGTLCSKPPTSTSPASKPTSDPFSRPGRTLGSAPTAPVPKISAGGGERREQHRGEAMSAAARAAEARASAKPQGKLARELERQKAQTRSESLNEASREERRRREVEGMEERRTFN
ncbi:MAG: hypothetical protein Q9195_002954 [Heterodermia aff. obscurata]